MLKSGDGGRPQYRYKIDPTKIAHYLLNDAHPRGRSKAKFFKAFGFKADEPFALAEALAAHAIENSPGRESLEHGTVRYVFEGPVITPDGRHPCVRSVWGLAAVDELQFITAVPLTR